MNAPVTASVPSAVTINIADVMRGIWRRKFMVLALMLLSLLASLFFVMTAKTLYTTEAKVLVDNLETPFERIQASDATQRREITDSDILSQVAVISSNDLAERVVSTLNLTERKEFDPLAEGIGKVGQTMIRLGFKEDPRAMSPEQRAMKRYNDMLKVYPIPDSKVIVISYEARDPKTAADVANALAEIYVTSTREAQSEPTGRARDWLSEQIENLRKKVVESESAAEEYRAEAGLLKGRETTLSNESLSELNTQIILAATQRAEAQAKAKSIREAMSSKGNVDSASEVLASPLIQRLREQQVALRRQNTELSVTYLPNHPKMIAVRSELVDLDRQIKSEVTKIVEGLEDQAGIAQTREATLRANLSAAKASASEANIDDVKLRALEREAAANRDILEALLNRFTDANARDSLEAQPGMARIIQRALKPSTPSFPRVGPTILLATIGGLSFGLGLAFLLEIMAAAGRMTGTAATPVPMPMVAAPRTVQEPVLDALAHSLAAARQPPPPFIQTAVIPPATPVPKVANPEPQSTAPKEMLPALCKVPQIGDTEMAVKLALEVISNPNATYAVALKQVASWATSSRQTLGIKSFAVGAIAGTQHDSATTAVALARAMSLEAARIIIVDTAMGSEQVDPVLGISPGPGLSEILVGHSKFAELITGDGASSVHVLRSGHNIDFASQFFTTNRMDAILKSLESSYDSVIVNLGNLNRQYSGLAHFCQAGVLLASPLHATRVAETAAEWRQAGLRAIQYVRINAETAAAANEMKSSVTA